MYYWFLGFLLGHLLGFLTDFFVHNFLSLFSTLIFTLVILRGKRTFIITSLAGFLWGASNSAPTPQKSDVNFKIIKTNLIYSKQGIALVEKNGKKYQVHSSSGRDEVGSVRVKKGNSIFHHSNGFFHANKPNMLSHHFITKKLSKFRSYLLMTLDPIPLKVKAWVRSILLGFRYNLSPELKNSFIKIGAYHLIVLSGLHLALLGIIFELSLLFPFYILYSLRLVSPGYWPDLLSLIRFLSIILVLLFALVVGMPVSVQRASIVYIVLKLLAIFYGKMPLKDRVIICLNLQALLFPIGFLNISLFLSWLAYLVILKSQNQHKKMNTIRSILHTQIILTLLIAGVIGKLSVLGLVVNPFLLPIFGLSLFTSLFFLLGSYIPDRAIDCIVQFHLFFLRIIDGLSTYCDSYPFLFIDLTHERYYHLRILFFSMCIILFLNHLRSLPIRSEI